MGIFYHIWDLSDRSWGWGFTYFYRIDGSDVLLPDIGQPRPLPPLRLPPTSRLCPCLSPHTSCDSMFFSTLSHKYHWETARPGWRREAEGCPPRPSLHSWAALQALQSRICGLMLQCYKCKIHWASIYIINGNFSRYLPHPISQKTFSQTLIIDLRWWSIRQNCSEEAFPYWPSSGTLGNIDPSG